MSKSKLPKSVLGGSPPAVRMPNASTRAVLRRQCDSIRKKIESACDCLHQETDKRVRESLGATIDMLRQVLRSVEHTLAQWDKQCECRVIDARIGQGWYLALTAGDVFRGFCLLGCNGHERQSAKSYSLCPHIWMLEALDGRN